MVMVSLHSNRNPEIEVSIRDLGHCYDRPEHPFVERNVDFGTLD